MKGVAMSINSDELKKINAEDVHLLSIGVSFNEKGIVDSVYLSKSLSPKISQLLKPGTHLTKKVREVIKDRTMYKNKVILFPVFVFDLYGKSNRQISLDEFSNLWPELSVEDKKKSIVILDPFPNAFHTSVN